MNQRRKTSESNQAHQADKDLPSGAKEELQQNKQQQGELQPALETDSAVIDSPIDVGAYFEEHAEIADPVELQAQLEALQAEHAELQDKLLRARAEQENTRRRAAEDLVKAHKFAIEKFAAELLPVKDSLEAALDSENQSIEDLRAGVELTLKQLGQAFGKSAVREENPVGGKFDPHLHQAVGMVDSDQPSNTVVNVLQKGYMLAERVLRPAMVMVSSHKDAE